ncbi:hypothetical protein PUNSTDRAFT_55590 [Punctularia strigosozonata HHB-11173 SS5]|uniref:MARVEL domain-containing protein n=1 Tax=Punctularia strigosozonata (strain HHB-11173) TaxID=741275 RepID=R7S248_PUNST|nr:uncharacterized protein PUNSTDRAFT_55590 [Punctularia strigosozonata HHB-11173 SS5]EIN04263.1 hypothetical protein PUNSTDRAFT_55590 [Punctularia strigosozonata HHB-11173 SS5]
MVLRLNAPRLRIGSYIVLWVFSFILFCLCAARLHYTTNLPKGDTLNGGRDFFDSVVVEMLVCTLLAFGFIPFVLNLIDASRWFDHPLATPVNIEAAALSILNLMWFVGAAITSSTFGDLTWCDPLYEACRVLTALQAFAWLSWVVLFALLALAFVGLLRASRAGAPHRMSDNVDKSLPAEPKGPEFISVV